MTNFKRKISHLPYLRTQTNQNSHLSFIYFCLGMNLWKISEIKIKVKNVWEKYLSPYKYDMVIFP